MIAKGIITQGLGGDATSMILGNFHLGFVSLEIEIVTPGTGGGSGPVSVTDKKLVIIRIKYKNKKYEKQYMVDKKKANILIKISKIVNKIVTSIVINIKNFRQKIKIKVKKK